MTITNTSMTGNIEIPKNMHLDEKADDLEFSYVWYKPKYIISLLAAPLFTYFLIQSDYIVGDFSQLTLPVYILVALALFVVYYSLSKLLNTTSINVNRQEISVRTTPLPMAKNLKLKKTNVKQLFVTRHRIGHRYYVYATTYQVNVILGDKSIITLVKGLDTPQQGRFIENKIEAFLNIKDVHVEGELEKS